MAKVDLPIHTNSTPQVITDASGVRIRPDTLYSNVKGKEKSGIRKYAEKELAKLADPLARMLEPDEAVLYLCRAQAPLSVLEQLGAGWATYYQVMGVMAITNKRMIHFLIKRDGSWKRSMKAVRWGDVVRAEVKGLLMRALRLKYRDGKTENYSGLRFRDASKLKLLAPALAQASTGEVGSQTGIVSLCPDCLAALTPEIYRCGSCGLVFKDMKTLVLRALLIPGGGYMYTGHWITALFFASSEGAFTLALVFWVLALLKVVPVPAGNAGEAPPEPLGAVISIAIVLGIEKLFHIYHSMRPVKDFLPTGRKEAPQLQMGTSTAK